MIRVVSDATLVELHLKAKEAAQGERVAIGVVIDPQTLSGLVAELQSYRCAIDGCHSPNADLQAWVAGERSKAYAVVEHELRGRRITQINLREGLTTAIRRNANESEERAPMPTLLGAVDLLGKP